MCGMEVCQEGQLSRIADVHQVCLSIEHVRTRNRDLSPAPHPDPPGYGTGKAGEHLPAAMTDTFPGYTKAELHHLQQQDPTIKCFRTYFDRGRKPSKNERKEEDARGLVLLQQWDRVQDREGLLYRMVQDPKLGPLRQVLLPSALNKKVLECTHDQMGHQGIETTLSLVRQRCYWPGIHA